MVEIKIDVMTKIVLCIIYQKIKEDYQFLLVKRTPEKGGFWQPVGGQVEKKDYNFLAAGYREILEETGIAKNEIINIIEDFYKFTFDKHYLTGEQITPVQEHVYAFEVKRDVIIVLDDNPSNEHEKYGWFSYDEVIKKLKWENNKESFEKLKSLLEF